MNGALKNGLIFGAGLLLGAAVIKAGERGPLLKPAMAGLVAGGLKIKDKAGEAVARAKEGFEDLVAEAEHMRNCGTDAKSAPAAEAKTGKDA